MSCNDVIIVTEEKQIILDPTQKEYIVQPVNKEIQLLPCNTVISIDGDTGNFAIVGDTTVEYSAPALETIQACEVIVDTGTGFELADANNLTHIQLAAGIALTTVLAGQAATSLIDGKIEDPKWSWIVGDPLFISTTPGQLTQTFNPGAAFSRLIGWALTPTLIHISQHDGTEL